MAEVTRRAAWREGAADGWHDDLVWYAAGIHQMRALTPGLDEFVRLYLDGGANGTPEMLDIVRQWDDPRSLGYQSQVHGTFVDKTDWPTRNGVVALWKECAHEHWFFLPWHRAYLLEFEAVVRGHVEALGGPADWALPYWDYSDFLTNPQRLGLPRPFQGATLPDGVTVPGVEPQADGTFPNPLFNPTRLGPDPQVSGPAYAYAGFALLRPHYANQQDTGAVSFGGGVLEDPGNPAVFHGGGEIGMLDLQPHGSVHGEVGGMMGRFETAALDPVFWVHHCNADRLWETYAHDLAHGYPFASGAGTGTAAHQSWTTQEFRFHRSDATTGDWTTVTWKAPDLLDVAALGYGYDTTAAPSFPVAPDPVPESEIDPFGLDVSVPEPVAEAGPVALADDLQVVLSGGAGGDDADEGPAVASFPADARWLLRFDGIRSALPVPTSYHVFLGAAAGDAAGSGAPDPDDAAHYAGLLTLFGVVEASRDDGTSAGDGQRRRLDVTAQVRAQAATLRPLAAPLRLVATNPDRDLAAVELSIERITLEFG